jgi:hypothetical protein
MKTTTIAVSHNTISQQAGDIRANWNMSKRLQRARAGRRRFARFLQLLDDSRSTLEIWAGGALADADVRRLVKR